eukprot:EG_transcript_34541
MPWCYVAHALVFLMLHGHTEAANRLYGVGKNDYGQLGNPAAGAGVAAAVEMVPRWGSTVNVTVRAGAFHTVVLAGNELFAVGANGHGQLGVNSTANQNVFVRILPAWAPSAVVTDIAAGTDFTVVLAGGKPYAVGLNKYGQLGDNSAISRQVFVAMIPDWADNVPATAVAAGGAHTVVLAGGLLYA